MRICAVVVTHNRLASLRTVVTAIRGQTEAPAGLLVVDNASSDGTPEWLAAQAGLFVIRQDNLGSGGGQRTGIAWACAQGYDWVWCFDDDAVPEPDALAALCAAAVAISAPAVLNSTVVAPNGSDLSFPLQDYSGPRRTLLRRYAEVAARGGPFESQPSFFNGTLLPREVVSRLGLPRAELFVRGDEVEYALRIRAAACKALTVPASRVTHPQEVETTRVLLGRRRSMALLPAWKAYYHWRNSLDLNERYDYLYPGRDAGWRRGRLVLQLLWELGCWYRFARPYRRALRLALSDWRGRRFRLPAESDQLP